MAVTGELVDPRRGDGDAVLVVLTSAGTPTLDAQGAEEDSQQPGGEPGLLSLVEAGLVGPLPRVERCIAVRDRLCWYGFDWP